MASFTVGNSISVKDVLNGNSQIFKNYVKKISIKLDDRNPKQIMKSNDFNSMIVWFNWCFFTRNDFYVTNLNSQALKNILRIYNQIKSNMLNDSENDLFNHLTLKDFKLLKFLLHQYINQFDSLTDDVNEILKSNVSKESIQNCITQINIYMFDNAEILSPQNTQKILQKNSEEHN